MKKFILIIICCLFFNCGEKESERKGLLRSAMDTGKELYLNTLLREIKTNPNYNKHTVDSIYKFRRDTILNQLLK